MVKITQYRFHICSIANSIISTQSVNNKLKKKNIAKKSKYDECFFNCCISHSSCAVFNAHGNLRSLYSYSLCYWCYRCCCVYIEHELNIFLSWELPVIKTKHMSIDRCKGKFYQINEKTIRHFKLV